MNLSIKTNTLLYVILAVWYSYCQQWICSFVFYVYLSDTFFISVVENVSHFGVQLNLQRAPYIVENRR